MMVNVRSRVWLRRPSCDCAPAHVSGFPGSWGSGWIMVAGLPISATGGQKLGIAYWKPFNSPDVAALAELLEAGKIRPVIDRRYPLAEVPDALRYVEDGHALGKVLIIP